MKFKTVFKYYWLSAKKYKLAFYLCLIFYAGAIILASVINPIILKKIVDLISNSPEKSTVAKALVNLVLKAGIIIFAYQTFFRIADKALMNFESNSMREIHNNTFSFLLKHSYTFFSNNFSGSLVAKAKRFSASFERIVDVLAFNFWFIFIELSGVFFVLFYTIPLIGFIFLIWVILYITFTTFSIKTKIRYDLEEAEADSKTTGAFADTITNVLNLKIFSASFSEFNLFKKVTQNEYEKRTQAWFFNNKRQVIQGYLMATLQIIVLYTMIYLWLKDEVSTGTLVLVQAYMLSIFSRIWDLGKAIARLMKEISNSKEMTDIFDQVPDILDPVNPEALRIKNGEISFENVSFTYIGGAHVFDDFNLKIKAGEKIGLVGHSGSGKSTITKILLRFADLKAGVITIDGQDISKITQDDLRSKISYVPQDSILFHRSLSENIGYSKSDARDEEIIDASKKAHAHEFISKFEKGYETLVGERGIKLSGGERQRVAIARAMLKSAPILLLDEATSSLDSISESYIQEAFNELMKGKTTIVIAHRLSTIQKMDRIIVLDNGKIVEEGNHKTLLEKGGFYADLWNHQTGGFLE